MPIKYCHCGQPLHYTDKNIEKLVTKLTDELGEFVTVLSLANGKKYRVQRHYIALHGIQGDRLDTYGFKESMDDV